MKKKREKRRRQKKRKRAAAKRCGSTSIIDTSSTTSDSSQDLQHEDEYEDNQGDLEGTSVDLSPLQQPGGWHNEEPDDMKSVDDFFAALDQISDENLKYWDMCVQKEIEELENYHDVHPTFVTDEKRAVVVQVTSSAHRRSSGLV